MAFFKRLSLLIVLVAIGLAVAGTWFATHPLLLRTSPLEFTIPPGTGLSGSARLIADAGVDFPPWEFSLLGRILGKAADIKAGSYEIESGVTPLRLLAKLTHGDVSQGELVLVEGRTFRQFRAQLDADPDLRHDSTGLTDREILARLGAAETNPEGLFFPDTYLFTKHVSDFDVLGRAYRAMHLHLADEWAKRKSNLPLYSAYEALTLASIIEKETGVAADRSQIAAVFINRLQSGMLLQTDPSVIYGMGENFDGNLRKRDLLADTPYNTYTRGGLPPTPISMPGLAALHAALNPPVSDKYYFVAKGDGHSEFSRTLDEHNRAVARYQKNKGKTG
ncbi:MAG: endolytic transglycosylase MltG [Proteobacteria bacterium]|nr:endolytic transglycosylase MltG [Pseudomonadota bacterium]HQR02513.1 endolytic transglycosylase MltG [Rhodocyclaceae bacterium]